MHSSIFCNSNITSLQWLGIAYALFPTWHLEGYTVKPAYPYLEVKRVVI